MQTCKSVFFVNFVSMKNKMTDKEKQDYFRKLVDKVKNHALFARIVGMDEGYVCRLYNREHTPYLSTLRRCEKDVEKYLQEQGLSLDVDYEEESGMVHEDEPHYNAPSKHDDPLVAMTMEKLHEAVEYAHIHAFDSRKDIDEGLLAIASQLLSKYRNFINSAQ